MNLRFYLVAVQTVLLGSTLFIAARLEWPWYALSGVVLMGAAVIVSQFAPAKDNVCHKAALAGVVLAALSLEEAALDCYQALPAFLIAIVFLISPSGKEAKGAKGSRWKFWGIIWGLFGTLELLLASYFNDQPMAFYGGFAAGFVLLVLYRVWFRPGPMGIQMVNTLLLLLLLLPAADRFFYLRERHAISMAPELYASYEIGSKNPTGFAFWSRYYEEQWLALEASIYDRSRPRYVSDDYPAQPRLRPGSKGTLFHCEIRINTNGFRGPDFPFEKGNAYRIVALGESTTFGVTMNAGELPWPELLENMIRERLHPNRPVQVINAGIPGATLAGNLPRLTNQILPLHPDMIISYHGHNGFYMITTGSPPVSAKPPPRYEQRPSLLLGNLEYALKLSHYKKSIFPKTVPDPPLVIRPMDSDYAKAYRKLIEFTDTNHIRLVLATYSMAVNTNSDKDIIDFYGERDPDPRTVIRANVAHSEIVRELAKEHPEICFVDTNPVLDGKYVYYHDLVHFTQAGRQLMAETFFSAIRGTLEKDLKQSEPTNQAGFTQTH